MKIQQHKFDNRTDICNYIERIRDKVIGKRILAEYGVFGIWGDSGYWPVILEFDDFAIAITYTKINNALIEIIPQNHLEEYINSFNENIQEAEDFPLKGEKVKRISVGDFSKSYEINGVTGERAPEGGDYFSTIRFHMENGFNLCLCGGPAAFDGWMDVWIDDENE